MKYRISTSNERVWCTTQLAKLSFNDSIGRTHSWRFSIFYKIVVVGVRGKTMPSPGKSSTHGILREREEGFDRLTGNLRYIIDHYNWCQRWCYYCMRWQAWLCTRKRVQQVQAQSLPLVKWKPFRRSRSRKAYSPRRRVIHKKKKQNIIVTAVDVKVNSGVISGSSAITSWDVN